MNQPAQQPKERLAIFYVLPAFAIAGAPFISRALRLHYTGRLPTPLITGACVGVLLTLLMVGERALASRRRNRDQGRALSGGRILFVLILSGLAVAGADYLASRMG